MKELTQKSFVLTASNVATRFAGYVYRILMGRLLTPYEFGILNLALPLQYMVMVVTSSGIAPALAKFIAESEAKRDEKQKATTIYSSLLLFVALGIAAFIAAALLALPISTLLFQDENVALPLAVTALAIPFTFALGVFTGTFQGLKKVDYMSIALVSAQALRIIFALALVYYSASALYAALGSTLGAMAALPIAYILFRLLGRGHSPASAQGFSSYDSKLSRGVLLFSLPISATAVATSALAYIDAILLGYFLSPVEVGIYSAASPTSRIVLALSSALYAVLLPSISEIRTRGSALEIRKYARDAYKIFLLIAIPASAVGIYFAEQIITLLFSERYVQAAEPFQILLAGTIFFGIFTINAGIFQGLSKPKLPMNVLIIAAVLDAALNLILIPLYGINGAAAASSLSLIFAGAFSTIALRRLI